MGVTLKLIVVIIFITYHFNVELCQSYSEPTNSKNTETPVRSLTHHWHRKAFQHPDKYDEQLQYIAALINQPETRHAHAQQWQAAVEIQPRSKHILPAEIQVGNPRLETKVDMTKATPVVDKEHQRKSKHSKKLDTRRQIKKNFIIVKKNSADKESTAQRISRKGYASPYNKKLKGDGYYGNRLNDKDRYEASDTYIADESHDAVTTERHNVLTLGNNKHENRENKVGIQYAFNLNLNQRLGDFLRNKVAAFKDEIRMLRSAGVPYLK